MSDSLRPHESQHARPPCPSQFDSWTRKIHWRRDRLPTAVFLGFPCGSAGKESACNAGNEWWTKTGGGRCRGGRGVREVRRENAVTRPTTQRPNPLATFNGPQVGLMGVGWGCCVLKYSPGEAGGGGAGPAGWAGPPLWSDLPLPPSQDPCDYTVCVRAKSLQSCPTLRPHGL